MTELEQSELNHKLSSLGLGSGWQWGKGAWLVDVDESSDEAINNRAFTQQILSHNGRFVAITAAELPEKEIALSYLWDLDGQLLSRTINTTHSTTQTIVDLSPAADWAERETHEFYAVEFAGRETTKPLMTRAGDPIGIKLHTEVAQ